MTKLTKQELYIERKYKEADIFKNKVQDSNSDEEGKIKMLKSKLLT